jgi:ADP-heptose:LPS heptosyltransferase
MTELRRVSRILAIRLARLGDVTLLLPSLGLLKAAFGGAHLTLLTGLPYTPVARLCPWVDDVMALDRGRMRDGPRRQALSDVIRFAGDLRRATGSA